MAQHIDVPGVGTVEFPDGMSDADMAAAIKQNYPDSAPSLFSRATQAMEEGEGGIPLKSMEDLKSVGTAYGEMAKGIPIIGGFVPQSEGMMQFEQQNPGAAKVTQGVGGVVATAPLMAAVPWAFGLGPASDLAGVAGNVGRGIASGAGIGGADAAARGESIPAGAGAGALVGGAAPAVGAGIGALWNGIRGAVVPAARGVLDGMNPQAVEWAARAAKADGLTETQIADMINQKGPEAFLGEYGSNLRGLTGAIHAQPGTAKTEIAGAFEDRAAGARQRVEDAVTDVLGPRVNVADLTRQGYAQRSANAGPLWDQFRTTTVHPTDELKTLVAGSGEGPNRVPGLEDIGLLNEARSMAQLESLATGEPTPPMQNFFTGGERKDWPTTQSFQYVKQAIDGRIEASIGPDGRPTQATRLYTMLKNRLDDVISRANPDAANIWQQARQAWAEPTAINNARRAGQQAWNPTTRRDEMTYQLSQYSPPEQQAYREGARDSLAEMMDRSANGDTRTRDTLLAPANQDKVAMLSTNGSTSADDLVRRLNQETAYRQNQTRTIANSETAQRQAMGQMTTPNPEDTMIARALRRIEYMPHVTLAPYIPLSGTAKNVAAGAQERAFEEARNALGPMLTSQGPQAQDIARALIAQPSPSTQLTTPSNLSLVLRALSQPAITVRQNRQQ
jgi:hypothetical protein